MDHEITTPADTAILAMTANSAPRAFIPFRPTAMERRHGRIMRAPDHDAGTPAAPAASDAAPAADGTPAADGAAGDQGQAAADAEGDGAPQGDGGSDTSLLGGDANDGDGTGDGDGNPDGEGDGGNASEAPVVPEKYELTVDGVELDAAALEEATPFFKEAGLTNDQANQIMPAAVKFRDTVANQTLQQIMDAGAQQKASWLDATKTDTEIGGGKLDETLHLAAKGLDALGYPEGSDFRKALTETGFGNHPEMVRMMRKVGEMVSEDGFARSGATPSNTLPVEKRLYPDD